MNLKIVAPILIFLWGTTMLPRFGEGFPANPFLLVKVLARAHGVHVLHEKCANLLP